MLFKTIKIKDYEENEMFTHSINPKIINNKKYFQLIYLLLIIIPIVILLKAFIFFYTKTKSSNIKTQKYDYLIVGSGLYGATFNYFAKKAGKTTLVIEKKNYIGGNLYCEKLEGINIHKYGPHISHTNNKTIWDFVNSLTHFIPYNQNQSLFLIKKKLYKLSFNFLTFFNQSLNLTISEKDKKRQKAYNETNNKDINRIIREYIEKQWGIKSENYSSFIFNKKKTDFNFCGYYYGDNYQGIPEEGYNIMIEKLLNNTEIITGIDYNTFKGKYYDIANTIVYTGKIDEYFDYKYGKLEYRTISWENQVIEKRYFQNEPIVNYLDKNIPFTRIIEYKHLEPFNKKIQEQNRTIIFYEYTDKWDENKEPFFPINDKKNNELYNKYKELANKEKNVIFGGRLAEYKYYEMNDIIEAVFKQWNV